MTRTPGEWDAFEDRIADLAAETGRDPEDVIRILTTVLESDSEPIRNVGIVVGFRWWERPRRLWARYATRRTDRYLAEHRSALDGPRPQTPNPSRTRP